jgi:hypothetical protein
MSVQRHGAVEEGRGADKILEALLKLVVLRICSRRRERVLNNDKETSMRKREISVRLRGTIHSSSFIASSYAIHKGRRKRGFGELALLIKTAVCDLFVFPGNDGMLHAWPGRAAKGPKGQLIQSGRRIESERS